mmetsp:Transcript_28461/g.54446  ORF Transcript_28461/g.54446 Transcript_28461/m.54446 type:complete len:111 (+) Transcript_28461:114-446(+)
MANITKQVQFKHLSYCIELPLRLPLVSLVCDDFVVCFEDLQITLITQINQMRPLDMPRLKSITPSMILFVTSRLRNNGVNSKARSAKFSEFLSILPNKTLDFKWNVDGSK